MSAYDSKKIFSCDYYRMTGVEYRLSFATLLRIAFSHNLQFAYWYRRYRCKKSLVAKLFLLYLSRKYGLEISRKACIGKGMYLGHPYNITIGEEVVIGKNVNLHKGCTIGKTNRGNIGSPQIGNNVYVGVNATIVGKIKIGNDVLVAPNSYVNFDVPDHSIVIGNPAKVISRDNATEDYIVFDV